MVSGEDAHKSARNIFGFTESSIALFELAFEFPDTSRSGIGTSQLRCLFYR
jgi:hypothetical protein